MEKIDDSSMNITDNNISKLKDLFPSVVVEGKIDFDALRTLLGDDVEVRTERYQFTWPGKTESIKIAQIPSSGTLRPDKSKSKYWDTTDNLYIEGDNLEVLKLLQKTYYGKIKMIYIDPPYNTGGDFVYNDTFQNSIKNYKQQTTQVSVSNPNTSGRFHTEWLNMMYSRLILSRNLLKDSGLIYISIDDNEYINLMRICEEVFGAQNKVGVILWKKKTNGNNMGFLPPVHDYIVCFAKNIEMIPDLGYPVTDEFIAKTFSNPDNDPRGPWTTTDLSANHKGPYYSIKNPKTGEIHYPPKGRYWVFNEEEALRRISDGRIIFGKSGTGKPVQKVFAANRKFGKIRAESWWDNHGLNSDATAELSTLFEEPKIFTHPKPSKLIYNLLKITTEKDDLVLDFFSGSATTADAVMQINAEDDGKRQFIMIQLPELCEKNSVAYNAGYKTICDIGEERIRRAGEKIKKEWEEKNLSGDLFPNEKEFPVDIGFKVFKLDSTNITPWDNENVLDEDFLFSFGNVFKDGRSNEDILYEIMLKYGIFDQPVDEIVVNNKIMYKIGRRYMVVCLSEYITEKDINAISQLSPRVVVFNEQGFKNDNDKINAEYNLKKLGVEDVKCV